MKLPKKLKRYFQEQGAKGGKIGGKARAANLSPERRQAIAKAAAKARWAKPR